MADAILSHGGIYAIRNTVNGKIYVGSSVHIGRRRRDHMRQLKTSTHKNNRLQAAWIKYGAVAFEFEVLEHVHDRFRLIEREQHWITELKADGRTGYNILPCAGSRAGSVVTEETRRKLSAAGMNRTHSDETRHLLSGLLTGKVRTDEMRARIRESAIRSTANKTAEQRSAAAKKGALTRAAKIAAMSLEERAIHDAKQYANGRKSANTKKAMGFVVKQETKDRQMAARVRRGPAENREIALRAWETKRARKLGAVDADC
jgi:group I intron endonuclease